MFDHSFLRKGELMHTDKYFELFGIKKISEFKNKNQLIKTYRRLALKYHPDRGGNSSHFRFVNDAYEYLKCQLEVYLRREFKKFTNKKFHFYGDGSIYDIEKSRWLRLKNEYGIWVIKNYKYVLKI